nr:hypothetical protein GCM10020093_064860 [Planobispora longispora]
MGERHGQVGLPGGQQGGRLGRFGLAQPYVHPGMAPDEQVHGGRDDGGAGRGEGGQPYGALPQLGQGVEVVGGGLQAGGDGVGVAEQEPPASVSRTPRGRRSTRAIPARRSRWRRCWLTAGWVQPRARAAPAIDPAWAISRKTSRRWGSIPWVMA